MAFYRVIHKSKPPNWPISKIISGFDSRRVAIKWLQSLLEWVTVGGQVNNSGIQPTPRSTQP